MNRAVVLLAHRALGSHAYAKLTFVCLHPRGRCAARIRLCFNGNACTLVCVPLPLVAPNLGKVPRNPGEALTRSPSVRTS
eukprot:5126555-Pleurochrysis_carterae.AAC.4